MTALTTPRALARVDPGTARVETLARRAESAGAHAWGEAANPRSGGAAEAARTANCLHSNPPTPPPPPLPAPPRNLTPTSTATRNARPRWAATTSTWDGSGPGTAERPRRHGTSRRASMRGRVKGSAAAAAAAAVAVLVTAASVGQATSSPLPTNLPTETTGIYGTASYTGTIPTELGLLTKATGFSLEFNALSLNVPTELGRLSQLKDGFSLLGNSLSSSIPTELGQLSLLTNWFTLAQNALSSSLPTELGQLIQMGSAFLLQENSLSSTVPTELGNLNQMSQGFLLKSNKLCSDVPTQVQALSGQITTNWEVTTGNMLGTPCLTWPVLPTNLPTSLLAVDLGGRGFTGTIPSQVKLGLRPGGREGLGVCGQRGQGATVEVTTTLIFPHPSFSLVCSPTRPTSTSATTSSRAQSRPRSA